MREGSISEMYVGLNEGGFDIRDLELINLALMGK